MEKQLLLINERFEINESLHTLTDKHTGTVIRLELRLLRLIVLLSATPNEVVSRQLLIHEIWDNYGGAEEGLNQAISFLRKSLADSEKKIILTVPKKGYLLNANVIKIKVTDVVDTAFKKTPILLISIVCGIIALTGLAYWYWSYSSFSTNKEPSGAVPDTTYQYKELDSIKRLDSLQHSK